MLLLVNLDSRLVEEMPSRQPPIVRNGIRSFFFLALGMIFLVSADVCGFPSLRTQGPYALLGVLLPGNLASCVSLIYAIWTERNPWWRVFIAVSLFASMLSLALVAMLILGHLLFLNFPGPG